MLVRIEAVGEGQGRALALGRPAEIADDRAVLAGDRQRQAAAIDAGARIARLPLPEGLRVDAKPRQGLMGGIEGLGVGLRIEPCPPLPVGLGGTVRRTVTVRRPRPSRREEALVQLLGGGERSLPVFAAMAARERYEFDLVAAGRALEAIERSGFLPAAVIADDEAIDALAERTWRLSTAGRSLGLQTGDPEKRDNLIHGNASFDFVEVDAKRFRAMATSSM